MPVRIQSQSRLQFADLGVIDGVESWEMFEPPAILEQADDTTYTVTDGDRIDLIANKFYGNPRLWWIVAVANDLDDLPTDLYGGRLLRIPSPRYITQEYFTQVRN